MIGWGLGGMELDFEQFFQFSSYESVHSDDETDSSHLSNDETSSSPNSRTSNEGLTPRKQDHDFMVKFGSLTCHGLRMGESYRLEAGGRDTQSLHFAVARRDEEKSTLPFSVSSRQSHSPMLPSESLIGYSSLQIADLKPHPSSQILTLSSHSPFPDATDLDSREPSPESKDAVEGKPSVVASPASPPQEGATNSPAVKSPRASSSGGRSMKTFLKLDASCSRTQRPFTKAEQAYIDNSDVIQQVYPQLGVSTTLLVASILFDFSFMLLCQQMVALVFLGSVARQLSLEHTVEFILRRLLKLKPAEFDRSVVCVELSIVSVETKRVGLSPIAKRLFDENKKIPRIYSSDRAREFCERVDELWAQRSYSEILSSVEDFVSNCSQDEARDVEVVWRHARAHADVAEQHPDLSERQKVHALKCLRLAREAEAVDRENTDVVRTMSMCLGRAVEFMSFTEQITTGPLIRQYAERAFAKRPGDFIMAHVLGRWHYSVADRLSKLSSFQKSVARRVASLPEATYDESLEWLNRSQEIYPDFIGNHVFLGLVHERLGSHSDAKRWLQQATTNDIETESDRRYMKLAQDTLASHR